MPTFFWPGNARPVPGDGFNAVAHVDQPAWPGMGLMFDEPEGCPPGACPERADRRRSVWRPHPCQMRPTRADADTGKRAQGDTPVPESCPPTTRPGRTRCDPTDGATVWQCVKIHARWTLRLLADRLVELELVESISHVAVGEALKKPNLSPSG